MHSSHLLHPLALFRRRARQPRIGELPRSPRDGLGPERRRDDDEDLQAGRCEEQPGVEQRLNGAADKVGALDERAIRPIAARDRLPALGRTNVERRLGEERRGGGRAQA